MKMPSVLISQEEIKKEVKKLADTIMRDYQGEELMVICVLKGSFLFVADLIRELDLPLTVEFISVSSYGNSKESSGEVKLNFDFTPCIEGKNVLIVEDIIDTGLTVEYLHNLFRARNPKSLKLATFLLKPSKIKNDVKVDYIGVKLEDQFVVGYGLDYAGKYRNLPYLGIIDD